MWEFLKVLTNLCILNVGGGLLWCMFVSYDNPITAAGIFIGLIMLNSFINLVGGKK